MILQCSTPRPLRAKVVNASDGSAVTSGVTIYHYDESGAQTSGDNSPSHLGNGLWSYTPSDDEHENTAYTIEFYHADAVASGPQFTVITKSIDDVMMEEAIRQGYRPGRDQIIKYADSVTDRGVNFDTAYTAAKNVTPTDIDWVTVFIPPWTYETTSHLTWDTDYIKLIALYPEDGGARQISDIDCFEETSLTMYRPPRTSLYSTSATDSTAVLSATSVWMVGFGIARLYEYVTDGTHGLYCTADTGPTNGVFEQMYFWNRASLQSATNGISCTPLGYINDVRGVYKNIKTSAYGLRCGYAATDNATFEATVLDSEFGAFSVGGDYQSDHFGTQIATNTFIDNCRSVGKYRLASDKGSGHGSFFGCDYFSLPIDDTCIFINVLSGNNSFGIGTANAATLIDCIGGNCCVGCTTSSSHIGSFIGTDIRGIYGADSLGGHTGSVVTGTLSGNIIGSCVIGSTRPHNVASATILGASITTESTGYDCIILEDGNSRIHDSTLLVVEGGTGIPISSASEYSVSAIGNRYNNVNAAGQANGLGTNVTNVGAPSTVTTDSASRSAITDHGDTNWGTADVSALATSAALAATDAKVDEIKTATTETLPTAMSSMQSHGDSTWSTATSVTVSDKTGFSLAADQSGVTIGTVGTVTNAVAATNATLAKLETMLEADGSNYKFSSDSLQESPAVEATAEDIANAIAVMDMSSVEAEAAAWSLCTYVLAKFSGSWSGTELTIYRSDGETEHATATVATDTYGRVSSVSGLQLAA